jgi:hypothetical protein
VVASILLVSGFQAYFIFKWPFVRMLFEQLTRGSVLVAVAVIGIFWGVDRGGEVLGQWVTCFAAGGAGLLGLATLRYLDDREREVSQRIFLKALFDGRPQATPPVRILSGRTVATLAAAAGCGAFIGGRLLRGARKGA